MKYLQFEILNIGDPAGAFSDEADGDIAIFEYIKVFYNWKWRHSTLGYKSPTQFLKDWISAQHDEKLVA